MNEQHPPESTFPGDDRETRRPSTELLAHASQVCPNCSTLLSSHRCKMVCPNWGFISVAQIFPNTALVLQSASSRIAIAEEGGRGLTIWLCTQFSTFV